MIDRLDIVFGQFERVVEAVVDPLRTEPEVDRSGLSIPEIQTTTVDGDVGWVHRPPARFRCPRCDSDIEQYEPRGDIDCTRCVANFSHEEFDELELQQMLCPECGDSMKHGQRHPNAFDVPEWATCSSCRYHWELGHTYSGN